MIWKTTSCIVTELFTLCASFLLAVRDHQLLESCLLILLRTATGGKFPPVAVRIPNGYGNGSPDLVGNGNEIIIIIIMQRLTCHVLVI